jgi:hypothetical protein
MRALKRKHNDLENNQIYFQKVRKLNCQEYEKNVYTACLVDDELANITDNMNNLSIKKNIGKLYYNIENPEKVKVQVTTKIKKPSVTMPVLKTENRLNFKKTFEQEAKIKSPPSKNII